MKTDDVRKLLRAEVKRQGGEAKFARQIGVSLALVYAVLNGTREPRGRILDALGLELTYRRRKTTKMIDEKP
jgi:DNA-binding phage protein